MTAEYKIMIMVMGNRICPFLTNLLQRSQLCGLPGKTIFYAVAAIREAVARAQVTRTPLCILSLDFQEAFDRISHSYLFAILESYGFSEQFQKSLREIYDNSTSSIQII
jgi:hypothetical protein